ncbi:50S ribosomal protein L32 [Fibrobacterota bacterium]
MAVPKNRTSKARRNKRRANWKISRPALATCSHCGHQVIPHRVCDNCGYYAGVEAIEPAE